jgi:hypothetical protein
MTVPRRALFPSIVLLLVCIASPVMAGQCRHNPDPDCWRATHGAIYELGNMIAFLEADPEIDDGYKAPVITRARADITRLRATLGPARWRWPTPCCYSRKPLYIR